MPTVPEQQLPRTSLRPVPAPAAPVQAPAAAFGQGEAALARERVTQEILADEKRRADQIALVEADNKLSALETRVSDLMKQNTGRAAFDVQDQIMEEYETGLKEIEAGLVGAAQVEPFAARALSRREDLRRVLTKHVDTEIKKFDAEEHQAFMTNHLNAAIDRAYDPESLNNISIALEGAIRQYGARNGQPGNVVDGAVGAAISKMHTGVVDRMLSDGNDLLAEEYFNANEDGFQGTDAIRVRKAVMAGSRRAEARRIAREIQEEAIEFERSKQLLELGIQGTGGDLTSVGVEQRPPSEMTLLEVMRSKNIKDPDIEEMVRERVLRDHQDDVRARASERNRIVAKALRDAYDAEDIGEIHPSVWENYLDVDDRVKATRMADRDRPTDSTVWTHFFALSNEELAEFTPDEFETTFRPFLSDSHYTQALRYYDAALEAKRTAGPQQAVAKGILNQKEKVKQGVGKYRIVPAEIQPRNYTPEQRNAAQMYQIEAIEALELQAQLLKRDLTPPEQDEILANKAWELKNRFVFVGDERQSVLNVTTDEIGDVRVPKALIRIPPEDRQSYIDGEIADLIVAGREVPEDLTELEEAATEAWKDDVRRLIVSRWRQSHPGFRAITDKEVDDFMERIVAAHVLGNAELKRAILKELDDVRGF